MSILVAFLSKHGATGEITERIAQGLRAARQHADARPVHKGGDLADYEGFVIGSAAYSEALVEGRGAVREAQSGTFWRRQGRRRPCRQGQEGAQRDEGAAQRCPTRTSRVQGLGLSREQITALTRKPEGDAPDIDARWATARHEATMPARFRYVTWANWLLHIADSGLATR
jgi:hypothetical protein